MLPFCRFQRQRCIKIRVLRAQDFYTPLALKTVKGQHLPALVVYKNQSPTKSLSGFEIAAFLGRRLMHHQNVSLRNAPSKRTLLTSLKRSKAGPPQLKRSKQYVLMVHFAVIRFDGASGACRVQLSACAISQPFGTLSTKCRPTERVHGVRLLELKQ